MRSPRRCASIADFYRVKLADKKTACCAVGGHLHRERHHEVPQPARAPRTNTAKAIISAYDDGLQLTGNPVTDWRLARARLRGSSTAGRSVQQGAAAPPAARHRRARLGTERHLGRPGLLPGRRGHRPPHPRRRAGRRPPRRAPPGHADEHVQVEGKRVRRRHHRRRTAPAPSSSTPTGTPDGSRSSAASSASRSPGPGTPWSSCVPADAMQLIPTANLPQLSGGTGP